jgi:hypothetical protein
MSIVRCRRLPIKRKIDDKGRSVRAGGTPSRPGLFRSINLDFKFKLAEDRFVKAIRSREVGDADVNV